MMQPLPSGEFPHGQTHRGLPQPRAQAWQKESILVQKIQLEIKHLGDARPSLDYAFPPSTGKSQNTLAQHMSSMSSFYLLSIINSMIASHVDKPSLQQNNYLES